MCDPAALLIQWWWWGEIWTSFLAWKVFWSLWRLFSLLVLTALKPHTTWIQLLLTCRSQFDAASKANCRSVKAPVQARSLRTKLSKKGEIALHPCSYTPRQHCRNLSLFWGSFKYIAGKHHRVEYATLHVLKNTLPWLHSMSSIWFTVNVGACLV